MAENSQIEWTDHTFNPWEGCVRVSAGCRNCYAEARDVRFTGGSLWGADADRRVKSPQYWRQPIRWDRVAAAAGTRARVFCASLADVFEDRPDLIEPRSRLFDLIESTPNLDWLLLTKRPENMTRLAPRRWAAGWPVNVWAGTSVENRSVAGRVIELRAVPAVLRFVSAEPLLGSVSGVDLSGVGWVIAGGESGRAARPMHPVWARELRDSCLASGVPFVFKQWGEWTPAGTRTMAMVDDRKFCAVHPAGMVAMTKDNPFNPFTAGHPDWVRMARVGKHAAGRFLDGELWDQIPQMKENER